MHQKVRQRRSRRNEVSVRSGQVEIVKVNTDAWQWRDIYRWLLGLSWPQFALFVGAVYVGLNLLFAVLYSIDPNSVAGRTSTDWFLDCFFFSVQTLATVGYGHMYPQTLYGHLVSTIEIMTGIFLIAVMTGLIFVRFSRPIARVVFSRSMVIAPLPGVGIDFDELDLARLDRDLVAPTSPLANFSPLGNFFVHEPI